MGNIVITPTQAAEMLNGELNRFILEAWMRQGDCPFGKYIKKEGCNRGKYIIFKERLEAYIKAQDLKAADMAN